MMAVAISIVVGCEGCIAYHVHDAVEAGATRAELLEAVSVGLSWGVDQDQFTPPMLWKPSTNSCLKNNQYIYPLLSEGTHHVCTI